jgi:hypothetical protein
MMGPRKRVEQQLTPQVWCRFQAFGKSDHRSLLQTGHFGEEEKSRVPPLRFLIVMRSVDLPANLTERVAVSAQAVGHPFGSIRCEAGRHPS